MCTLLNSHPDILCHHELFNPNGIFYALDLRDNAPDLGSVEDRDSDPLGFLNRLWQVPTSCSCVGFKMTRDQAGPVMKHVIEDRQIKKLLLTRRNRIKTMVSELIAQETNQWELYSPGERIEPPKVRIGMSQLMAHVAENDNFYSKILTALNSSNQTYLELEYETLISRTEQERILTFLGIQATEKDLISSSIKQNPVDLRNVISNFSELDAALVGTDYHQELHDRDH